MLVCMRCFEIYKKNLTRFSNENYIHCPKENCIGEVVDLDELIAPTIIELNKKGYYTKYCCSGHWYQEHCNIYIYFENSCIPENIPEGFTLEDNYTIRSRFIESGYDNKYEYVMDMNKRLYEWAKNADSLI